MSDQRRLAERVNDRVGPHDQPTPAEPEELVNTHCEDQPREQPPS